MRGRFRRQLAWVAILVAGIALPAGMQASRQTPGTAQPSGDVAPAEIAQGKTFGHRTAPVEIEDFTDFECPACRAFYLDTLRPLIQQYVSSGKVYLVHHDLPLPIHPYSHKAAYYADAAAAIGRFGPVENALFVHQPEWAANGKIRPFVAEVLTPADLKRVDALIGTKEIQDAVQRDFNQGMQLGISETPTTFITYKGRRITIPGVVSFTILRGYIDALLRQ